MTERENTGVTSHLEILRGEVSRQHDKVNRLESFRISTVGERGDNGWRSNHERRLGKVEDAQDAQEREIAAMKLLYVEQRLKLALLVGAASMVGTGVMLGVIQLVLAGQ